MEPGIIKLGMFGLGLVLTIFGPILGLAMIRGGNQGGGAAALIAALPIGVALMWNAF